MFDKENILDTFKVFVHVHTKLFRYITIYSRTLQEMYYFSDEK